MEVFRNCTIPAAALILVGTAVHATRPAEPRSQDRTKPAAFRVPAMWGYSAPLIAPEKRDRDPSRAQKDPTVVFHGGKWHVFMTVKLPGRSAIEYCSFERWEEADRSRRTILKVSDSDYYCAPQVFYFSPHKKWYLVYQMAVPGAKSMWVAYSTTTTIADADSWTGARPILDGGQNDPREVGGLDYWIICDAERAYLFLDHRSPKYRRSLFARRRLPRSPARALVAPSRNPSTAGPGKSRPVGFRAS